VTKLQPAHDEHVINCPLCTQPPLPIISLGLQPLAQDFLPPDQPSNAPRYELLPQICLSCGLAQLKYRPASTTVFSESYPYRSGVSQTMCDHLQRLAEYCVELVAGKPDPFMLEIGCNDGTLSRHFVKRRLRHLGIDPACRAIEEAAAIGVEVLNAEFDRKSGQSVLAKYGKADVIVAANVIGHIADLRQTFEQVSANLAPEGVFIFEAISLFELMQRRAFDLFYDEHIYTFSATSVDRLARLCGLDLIDCQPVSTQGGSWRYSLVKTGTKPRHARVCEALRLEQVNGLLDPDAWADFAADVAGTAKALRQTLDQLRNTGYALAGYGATAKSSVALAFAGIGRSHLDCIFDTTPAKLGLTSPCDRIPIRFPEAGQVERYDYLVMFAWNFLPEIEKRERAFRDRGGKWITYHGGVQIA
jgi:methylation protein EvaC